MKNSTEEPDAAPPRRRRWGRRLRWAAGLLGLVVVLLGLGILLALRASLARLDGEEILAALEAPVVVDRDALGITSIRGENRLDVARATGFVHAQDRYFQMDLSRRRSAGELAELLGSSARGSDLRIRIHRFRQVARRAFQNASGEERALIEAYTEGVNAGLGALGGAPFEYLLLRVDPQPWLAEDSYLVILSLFIQLQDRVHGYEATLGAIHDLLPAPLANFLTWTGSAWDAPLLHELSGPSSIPGPEVLDLRNQPSVALLDEPHSFDLEDAGRVLAGSNGFAVASPHAAAGAALLANDVHWDFMVPNMWYRLSLAWPKTDEAGDHRVTGVSIPGIPLVVVGSNTRIAWGFTNGRMDTSDLVQIEVDPNDDERYLTPEGPMPFERFEEVIRIRAGGERKKEVVWTRWGPLFDKDHQGRQRSLAWVAHHHDAVNLELRGLEMARDVDDALTVAHRSGIPVQNIVVADAGGRIAWSVAGRLPHRVGFDGRTPTSWADGSRFWDGWLTPEATPRVVDPESGRIWSANNRAVGGEELIRLGDGNYSVGARARQIRDGLFSLEKASEKDLLAIQLDHQALFLEPWQELLLESLSTEAWESTPQRRLAREVIEAWGGHAAVDSVGYRLVRAFRGDVARKAFRPLTRACREANPGFNYLPWDYQEEGPLWTLVTQRPLHLLDPSYVNWEELFQAALDEAIRRIGGQHDLAERVWGERNTVQIRHPMSGALPSFLRPLLDMPADQLPGDVFVPRAQSPIAGSSQRMVVSPGRESAGIFHMVGGQSGHPLSPHYRDQHAAWVHGEPTPFLPGEPAHTLRLIPRGGV